MIIFITFDDTKINPSLFKNDQNSNKSCPYFCNQFEMKIKLLFDNKII